ncbi:MAG: hypothetical protein CVU39_18145 [Chloroflexi bacterium HGW-Chloroflexi-10]|nr:MAG: hypothetical protein CVU39_18145 [Chloroflexi bacterium HGW-Chloroflexi-10]
MRCRKCNQKAIINMRQHKLALCRNHFPDWILEQTQRFIDKYKMFTKEQKILVAVSGGKDSLALWDVLQKLGYQTGGLHINLGIQSEENYSNLSQQITQAFANKRGLTLHIENIEEKYGCSTPQLSHLASRGKDKPCAVCGLVKRHTMNEIASVYNYDVLTTGHNLDDEVAVLFNNVLSWQVDFLKRQSPVLPAKVGLLKKAKPFCRFYEKETAAYAILNGIEYIEEECPHVMGSTTLHHKELLNALENKSAGSKLAFYLKFLKAKESLFLNLDENLAPHDLLFTCPNCGQPTPQPGNCTFCKVIQKATLKLAE